MIVVGFVGGLVVGSVLTLIWAKQVYTRRLHRALLRRLEWVVQDQRTCQGFGLDPDEERYVER